MIFDDSMYSRNRSKAVEMLARFKDHATGAFYRGFRMLTMGWSDGHSFVPMDFALLSSAKSGINGTPATKVDGKQLDWTKLTDGQSLESFDTEKFAKILTSGKVPKDMVLKQ